MPTTDVPARRVRVMSYNVRHLALDPAAAAATVRAADPDVLGMQEPPRTPWGRVRLRRWARAAGLRVVAAGGGARTTALLVAPRLGDGGAAVALRLPWWGSWSGRRTWTRRGAVVARLAGWRVVVVHLGLDAAERERHAGAVLARLAAGDADEAATVLLGDLNEPPGGPAWSRLATRLRDADPDGAPTFPAHRPAHRIDTVLVSPAVLVRSVLVSRAGAARRGSDHLPVVAELALAPEAPG